MKRILYLMLCLLIIFSFAVPASAETSTNDLPYDSYVYRNGETPLAVPAPYSCDQTFEASDFGIDSFKSMSDLYYNGERLFICDSGNNRIIILDSSFRLIHIVTQFENNGVADTFNEPTGVYERDGVIYIADSKNSRIVEIDSETFALKKILNRPEISLLEDDYTYTPQKLTVDAAGNIYVIAEGINRGLIEIDENGEFSTFLGAPSVVPDFIEQIWRRIASKEQRAKLDKYVPTEYNALYMDDYGFIYAVAKNTENTPFVKLNSQGTDVLQFKEQFGDEKYVSPDGLLLNPYFIDLAIDQKGFYYLLDSQQGKIYVYTDQGKLLYAFGANGSQQGTFYSASAIELVDNKLLVIDSSKNTLNVYKLTEFGSNVMNAVSAHNDGKYEQARGYWQEVHSMCSHYPMAIIELANLDVIDGNCKKAMTQLKAIGATEEYDEAFSAWRSDFLRSNMVVVIFAIIVVTVALVLGVKLIKKTKLWTKISKTPLYEKYSYGSYAMFHPFDGFWDIKRENRGSLGGALLTLALFTVLYGVRAQFSGYIVLGKQSSQINALYQCAMILLPLLMFVVANWCFTTLMDGEGTFKDIVIFSCYALKPYVVFSIPMFIFSHILSSEELMIYNMLDILTLLWVLALLFIGMMMTHNFSLSKTVLTAVCTLVGVCLILFIVLLLLNIVQDVTDFVMSLYNEIAFRTY